MLQREVEKFRAWADRDPGEKRSGEWELDYPEWDALYKATIEFVVSTSPSDWTATDIDNLLYVIARDNEAKYLVDEVAKEPDRLLRLSDLALNSTERDAKWQLASRLGALSDRAQEAEALLLKLVEDKDEYVSRRALQSLGEMRSPKAEALAERAWNTGHEYQRIAALCVLREISSEKMPIYLKKAMDDGREYVVRSARNF